MKRFPAVAAWALGLLAGPAAAGLVLNEIHPDPAGSDAGREFVEILNTGPEVFFLEGVQLSFANGATGGPWEVRWTGGPGGTLEPGDRLLITDRNWSGAAVPDTQVWLGLQNGPDAVQLSRDGAVLDRLGYGALTDPLLMETAPAVLKPGASLARRPDGRDSQDNRADFVAAEPTPGRANFLPYELTLAAVEVEPPSLDRTGQPVAVFLRIVNTGTEIHPGGPVSLTGGGGRAAGHLDDLPPDASRDLAFRIVPEGPGVVPLTLELPPRPDEPSPVLPVGRLQVGPGAVVLNEVVSRPRAGQGEWIEILQAGTVPLVLDAFLLSDADGDPRPLPGVVLEPGAVAVFAEDSLALAGWIAGIREAGAPASCPDPAVPRRLAGWPTLNNTPPADRDYADRVILADTSGLVLDHLTLGGEGLTGATEPEGRSLERLRVHPVNPGASNWGPSGAVAGGSPGCPTGAAGPAAAGADLSVVPPVLDRSRTAAVRIGFALAPGEGGWRARIYDLSGTLVRDLGGDDLAAGPRELVWDGRDDGGRPAGPGAYLVLVRSAPVRRLALVVVR